MKMKTSLFHNDGNGKDGFVIILDRRGAPARSLRSHARAADLGSRRLNLGFNLGNRQDVCAVPKAQIHSQTCREIPVPNTRIFSNDLIHTIGGTRRGLSAKPTRKG